MTATVWNTLSPSQMFDYNIEPTEVDEILQWYNDVVVSGLFEVERPGVDVAVRLFLDTVDGVDIPTVVGTIYLDGMKANEIVNYYHNCVDAKNLVDSGAMDAVVKQ